MAVVYVREQGATIRKDGEQLRVTQKQQELLVIPLANLEQIILMGNVQITTPAATFLMRRGVDVVFMSQNGTYQGHLGRRESKHALLRHQQLRLCDDDKRSLEIAKQIVMGKINNQRVILQRRDQRDSTFDAAIRGMADMLHRSEQATTLDQLRGFEGKAAAWYFESIRPWFPPEWAFTKREYYPPPDPANALLSFAYTLLRKDVEAKIQLVGLDPYLGFFHALGYDRPALALDLMEEFRPTIADLVILTLVTNGEILLEDFVVTNQAQSPIRMSKEAIAALVMAYEGRLDQEVYHPMANGRTSYRRAIELQVRQMAQVITQEQSGYSPLEMR